MSSKSRSRNCSTSETESVTDISCEENIQAPSQRFILSPGMYYQDTVFRTYSYAPPVMKNYPPAILQQDLASTISTCVKPEMSSYRYRYYAPNAPIPASRLIKGEAAPKRYEQSMSFQNFPPRIYPTSQSYDGSFRNINFDPMFSETRVEQFNRPVSNMWQMAGSSANTTSSSQKFLNQYNPIETNPQGYGNYFQDKNVFNNNNLPQSRNRFTLKALGIIGLIFLIIISVAVVLSIVFTKSSFNARSLLKSDDIIVNETMPRLFNVTTPVYVVNSTLLNTSQKTDLVLNLTTTTVIGNTSAIDAIFLNDTLNMTENVTVEVLTSTVAMENLTTTTTTTLASVTEITTEITTEKATETSTETSTETTTEITPTTTTTTTTTQTSVETTTESVTTTTVLTTTESTTLATTFISTELSTTVQSDTNSQTNTSTNQTLLTTN